MEKWIRVINMEELNNLFDDIRVWNHDWMLYDDYRHSLYRYNSDDQRPSIPLNSDRFIDKLALKYKVTRS